MIKSNFVVWDVETGGLEKFEHPITQFACMIIDGATLKEIDRWETFIKPYADLKITKESLEKTMVKMSQINAGIDITVFNKTITQFLKQHNTTPKKPQYGKLVPVGHNVQFDLGFLEVALALEANELYDYITPNYIDTLPMSKLAFGIKKEEKINLGAACEAAGIKLTDAHGAMNDVEATAELLRFFTKRLRNSRGEGSGEKEKRAIGKEFFEFKCAK